jgi:hypothetical protein
MKPNHFTLRDGRGYCEYRCFARRLGKLLTPCFAISMIEEMLDEFARHACLIDDSRDAPLDHLHGGQRISPAA